MKMEQVNKCKPCKHFAIYINHLVFSRKQYGPLGGNHLALKRGYGFFALVGFFFHAKPFKATNQNYLVKI